jgi:hypothetical protein
MEMNSGFGSQIFLQNDLVNPEFTGVAHLEDAQAN